VKDSSFDNLMHAANCFRYNYSESCIFTCCKMENDDKNTNV